MSEDNFENIETIIEDAPDIAPGANGKAEEKVPSKQADILIRLARAATFFHTPDDEAVADIQLNGHRETHLVRSLGFRKWLRHRFFEVTESGCSNEALKVAIDTIAAIAQHKGPEMPIHVRIAGHEGAIYIDLGDASWRAIEVIRWAGKSSTNHPSALCAPPASAHCRCRRAAAQSNCCDHSAI